MGNYLTKFASTLVAASVLLLLLGYLYFFELKKTSKEESKKEIFAGLKEEQINEIDLRYPQYSIVCTREQGSWYVLKDSEKFKGDDKIISETIDNISKIRVEKVVSESSGDMAAFGLEIPVVEVLAKAPDKQYRISIGADSPVGSGTYIKSNGENKVLLVERSFVVGFLNKSVNDFRNKQVVNLGEDKIKGMRFKTGGLSFELERKKGEWAGKGILEYVKVDQHKMAGIASAFADLRVDNFESDNPKELKSYGFSKPRAEVELVDDGGTVRILFGNKKEDGRYYMKLSSGDSIYSVSEFIADRVPKELNDFRVVRVVELDMGRVSVLEIHRGEQPISLVKEKNNWFLKNEKDKKVDQQKVQGLLEKIGDLEVVRFLEDDPKDLAVYGLDKPDVQLIVSEGDKKVTISFGKKESQKVYAKLADSKSVFALNDKILSAIFSSKDQLINK